MGEHRSACRFGTTSGLFGGANISNLRTLHFQSVVAQVLGVGVVIVLPPLCLDNISLNIDLNSRSSGFSSLLEPELTSSSEPPIVGSVCRLGYGNGSIECGV